MRCLAGLAEVTGAADVRVQAEALLDGISLPSGWAWLHGVDAYVSIATAQVAVGQADRAAAVLEGLTGSGSAPAWTAVLEAAGAFTVPGLTSGGRPG